MAVEPIPLKSYTGLPPPTVEMRRPELSLWILLHSRSAEPFAGRDEHVG